MIRRPPRSTQSRSSAASDVYKRQAIGGGDCQLAVPPQRDGGVRKPECLGDGLDNSRENRFGRQRALKPLAETGEDGVGLVALAVEQTVDPALELSLIH